MKRKTRIKDASNGRLGAAMSAAVLASLIMTGGAVAVPPVYDDNAFILPNTAFPDQQVILENGATLLPSLTGGSLEAGGGYVLRSGTIDNVALNDGLVGGNPASANLTKETDGIVTLVGDSNYTGGTYVNEGFLILGDGERNARLLGTSDVYIANGAALVIAIGDNTFSLPNATSFTSNGAFGVVNEEGQVTTLSGLTIDGGVDSLYGVVGGGFGGGGGGGKTILVNTSITAEEHTIYSGIEEVDAGSSINADEITLRGNAPLLDVNGGSIADQSGTGRSDIVLDSAEASLIVRNGGSVRADVFGYDENTNVTVTGANSRLRGSITLNDGTISVSSDARITGGWGDSISILTSGNIELSDGGRISTGRIFLNDGNLVATEGSRVRVNRSIHLGDGNIIGTEGSSVSAGRNIVLEDGRIMLNDSTVRAGRDIELHDGSIRARNGSVVRAGRDITLRDGDFEVNRSFVNAGRDITLRDGDFEVNRSFVNAGRDITLRDGDFEVKRSFVNAGENITLRDGDFEVDNSIIRAGRSIIVADGDFEIDESIVRAGRSIVLLDGDLEVKDDSVVRAGRSIVLMDGNLEASDSFIRANQNIYLADGSLIARNDSDVIADRGIRLANGSIRANNSNVLSRRDMIVESGDIVARNGSHIGARGDIALGDGHLIASDSHVFALGDISLDAGGLYADGSTIRAQRGSIYLADGNLVGENGSSISAGRNVILDNGSISLVDSTLTASGTSWRSGRVVVRDGDVNLDSSILDARQFTSEQGNVGLINGSAILANTRIHDGLLYIDQTSRIMGRTVIGSDADAWVEGAIIGDVYLRGGTGDFDGAGLLGTHVSITGDLYSNGIISPGVEFGTTGKVIVNGDFYQASTSSYYVDILSKNNYDQIVVSGSATIEGGDLYVDRNGYKPRRNDTFRIVDAAGGIDLLDTYTVHHNFATNTMLEAHVRYSDSAVKIHIEQLKFASRAKTPNQRAVAGALDHAAKRGQLDSLFDHLNYTNRNNVPRLLQLLSPEALTAVFDIGFANSQIQNINIERRLDDVRNGSRGFSASGLALSNNRGTINYDGMPIVNDRDGLSLAGFDGKTVVKKEVVAPIVEESRWGFFVTGSGEWADIETTREAKGGDFASGGVTVGADYRVNDNFVVGLFGGYVHTKSDMAQGGDIKANGGRGGVYGSFFNEGLYVNALASGGYNHYKINRDTVGGTARGKTDGGQFDALLGAGYDFSLGCVTLGPVGSLQYSYVGFDKFSENGSDSRLHVEKNSQDSLRTLFGAKVATSWNVGGMVLRPEVRAQWKHEYLDRSGAIDSSFTGSGALFTVHGPKIGRDSLVVDAGASLDVSETLSIYAYYTGEIARENYSSNSVNGGFRINF